MTEIDYQTLNLDELKQMKKDVANAIAEYDSRRRKEALERINNIARELGFTSAAEILDTEKAKRKLSKPQPYYRDPNNPHRTAPKMGRKPNWLKAALLSGYTEEELRIEK